MTINQGQLLVIQGINKKLSIPGGSSKHQEPAYCTAHRETREETGLHLLPTKLVAVWPNGFHMYLCELHEKSGTINVKRSMEIIDVKWLHPSQFDNAQWRFPKQRTWLKKWLGKHDQIE